MKAIPICVIVAWGCVAGLTTAGENAPSLPAAIAEARDLQGRGRYEDAIQVLRSANERVRGRCAECWLEMAEAHTGLQEWKRVLQDCDEALRLGVPEAPLRARCHNLKGAALVRLARGKAGKLREAEQELRLAREEDPADAAILFNLGYVLLRLERDAEGREVLGEYLRRAPQGAGTEQARSYLDNPRRAREVFAPSFEILTSSGDRLSLGSLRGRLVVLDFWASWCRPCIAAVPEIKALLRKHPDIVVVSVSADHEEEPWRAAVERLHMTWPQYHDSDGKVAHLFDVRAFPTYVVIDGDGAIVQRITGLNERQSLTAKLRSSLKRWAAPEGGPTDPQAGR